MDLPESVKKALGHDTSNEELKLGWKCAKVKRIAQTKKCYTWGVQVVRYPNFFLGNGSR